MPSRPVAANPARRAKAEAGLYPFLVAYFIKREPLMMPICDFHKELCAEIDRALLPKMHFRGTFGREFGKSTIGTKGTVVYAAASGKKKFILIIAANMKEAEMKLDGVMDAFTWPEIQADYGNEVLPAVDERRNRDVKNSLAEVRLANGCLLVACEAMGRQRGKLSRGRRPDLVILDDPEDDDRVLNKEWRKRFRNVYLKKVLLNGLDSERGSSIWMGTLLHPDSPLHHEIYPRDPIQRKNPYIHRLIYNAMDPHRLVGPDNVTPDEEGIPKVLWPQRWPYAKLMERKELIGTTAFNQEFMNDPRDRDGQVFKPDDWRTFNYALLTSLNGRWAIRIGGASAEPLPFKQIVTYIDPAFSKQKGDYTALVTWGHLEEYKRYYLIGLHRQQVNAQGVVDLMVEFENTWLPDKFGVEMIALQDVVLADEINSRLRSRIIKVRSNQLKSIRIETLAAPFETGAIYIPEMATFPNPRMLEAFYEEAYNFPSDNKGSYDDMLDAAAGGIALIKRSAPRVSYTSGRHLTLAGNHSGGY